MKVPCNTESLHSFFWCSIVGMTSFRTSITFTDYRYFMSSLSLVFCWGHCRPATFRATALYGGDTAATCLTSCSRTTHLSSPWRCVPATGRLPVPVKSSYCRANHIRIWTWHFISMAYRGTKFVIRIHTNLLAH